MMWTEERISILRSLWESTLSSGMIAKIMDTTRNAVLGKAHRLDLPARLRSSGMVKERREEAPRPPRYRAPKPARILPKPEPEFALKEPAIRPDGPIGPAAVMAMRDTACKFPVGDIRDGFRVCSEPIWWRKDEPPSPYCRFHHKIAYQPRKERKAGPNPKPVGRFEMAEVFR